MKYATKQIFDLVDIEEFYTIKEFEGNKFSLRDDPSKMHVCKSNGNAWKHCFQYPNDPIEEDEQYAKELIIHSKTLEEAELISNLVQIGCLLGYPLLQDFPNPSFVTDLDFIKDDYDDKVKTNLYNDFYGKEPIRYNLVLGCSIAAKSFGNLKYIYCLKKYRFSLKLSSLTPNSLHPYHGEIFKGYEYDYDFHIQGAYSFLAAYSIIEDLGIDIRSSQKNPRFIKVDGEKVFNPVLKNNVLERLAKINIDGDELITFSVRGNSKNLTDLVVPILGEASEFNHYKDVNDIDLTIVEAIHYCSYIRSFYLAHGFTKDNLFLTPYDVDNVQKLIRRILLDHFGF